MGRRPKTYIPENANTPSTPPSKPQNTTPKEPLKSLCYDLNNPNYSVLDPDSYNRTTLKIYKYSFITHKYSQEIPISEALITFKTPYLISYFGHKKLSKDAQSRDTTDDFWQKTTHICPVCGEKTPLSMFQIDQNIRLTITYETKKRSKSTSITLENTSENTENIESSLEKPFKKQSIFNQILSSEPLLVCGKCSQKAWKERVEALKKAYKMTSDTVKLFENEYKNEYESAFSSTENDSNDSKNDSDNPENPPKKKRGRPRKMA